MSTNTILRTFVKCLFALSLLQISTMTAKADQVSLGGFTGTLTSTVSSGLSMRTEDNNCRLISGTKVGLAATDTAAIRANFTDHVGYAIDNGNGGCNIYETDAYGNTSTKAIERINVNQDSGKLNFLSGDIFDAGNSLSMGFFGENANGVKLNLSGLAYYNAALDFTTPAFQNLTSAQKDEFENQFKLGNAFVETPLNDNVSFTIGNYVQSQGVTALLPIGVNVVNPVSLPILRSPGASLKDALLPQAMLGATAYLEEGITMEAYYQLEQKEVEIDVSRSFNGSDFVGRHSSTNLTNSANYRENTAIPFGGNYFDAATCFSDGFGAGGTDACLWAGIETDGSGTPTADGETAIHALYNQLAAGGVGGGGMEALVAGWNAANVANTAADMDEYITKALASSAGSLLVSGPGAQNLNTTLTDAQILASLARANSQYAGIGNNTGLVAVRRAPDSFAKNSGQYGINLSGYLDDVGSGVEWGVYFNNSHSNSPRIRFLAIQDGYASTLYAAFNSLNTAGAGKDFTDGTVTPFEQTLANTAYNSLLCGVIYKAAAGSSPAYGTFASTTATAKYLHDPETCYSTLNGMNAALPGQAEGAALGALGTLGFGNAARYQIYYPEDIKTYGASLATGIGSWATNVEVAFRPDFPFQVDVSQALLNVYDSTGGTMIQSLTSYATAGGDQAAIAAANAVSLQKWSSQPNCDISSATGTASTDMAGYAVCDGTAEHDVWTLDMNTARSFTASDPISVGAGADGGSILVEIGAVIFDDYDHAQGLVATNHQASGHDVYGGGCLDMAGTSKLAVSANGLFGNGYCENNSGPDDLAMTSRIRGALNYFNFNNSAWTFSPSLGIDYDFLGNAPASLGGWVEDEMSVTLGSSFTKGGTSINLSYVAELGNYDTNASSDKDYISASVSHSF